MRPQSLAEVAALTAQGDNFDRCLANFLDDFYATPRAEALLECPSLLAPQLGKAGQIQDAYLAATAEHLAGRHSLPFPMWTLDETRQLHVPYFATPQASVRAVLLLESPAAFRSRNLFVSENALSRA